RAARSYDTAVRARRNRRAGGCRRSWPGSAHRHVTHDEVVGAVVSANAHEQRSGWRERRDVRRELFALFIEDAVLRIEREPLLGARNGDLDALDRTDPVDDDALDDSTVRPQVGDGRGRVVDEHHTAFEAVILRAR